MISRIRGEVLELTREYCVIMTGGVGYKVYIPDNYFDKFPDKGDNFELYTYLSVREDALTLYGFTEPEELAVFELIMGVSGVGPKIALSVVNAVEPTQFYLSIMNDQVQHLTKVPGIGKKSAQRIILELKEKVKEISTKEQFNADMKKSYAEQRDRAMTSNSKVEELSMALKSLGYTTKEIDKAINILQGYLSEESDMEDLLKLALQELNKR